MGNKNKKSKKKKKVKRPNKEPVQRVWMANAPVTMRHRDAGDNIFRGGQIQDNTMYNNHVYSRPSADASRPPPPSITRIVSVEEMRAAAAAAALGRTAPPPAPPPPPSASTTSSSSSSSSSTPIKSLSQQQADTDGLRDDLLSPRSQERHWSEVAAGLGDDAHEQWNYDTGRLNDPRVGIDDGLQRINSVKKEERDDGLGMGHPSLRAEAKARADLIATIEEAESDIAWRAVQKKRQALLDKKHHRDDWTAHEKDIVRQKKEGAKRAEDQFVPHRQGFTPNPKNERSPSRGLDATQAYDDNLNNALKFREALAEQTDETERVRSELDAQQQQGTRLRLQDLDGLSRIPLVPTRPPSPAPPPPPSSSSSSSSSSPWPSPSPSPSPAPAPPPPPDSPDPIPFRPEEVAALRASRDAYLERIDANRHNVRRFPTKKPAPAATAAAAAAAAAALAPDPIPFRPEEVAALRASRDAYLERIDANRHNVRRFPTKK